MGIACDASNVGIGAVLFNCYPDGSERPISNVSKTLTPTQHCYSQIHKEALAVVFGLKRFHQFLYGRGFVLVTDHKPLIALCWRLLLGVRRRITDLRFYIEYGTGCQLLYVSTGI